MRDYVRIIIHQREAPEAVALGICIGLFVGFSPLYGLQMILALLLALILHGSKIAAMLTVWITNPLTVIPIYSLTYWLGVRLLSMPHQHQPLRKFILYCIHHVHWQNPEGIRTVLNESIRLGRGILPPLFVGGLAAAAVSSLICYPLAKACVRHFRAVRSLQLMIGEKK
jgi:uncharacterized protein (DUF2062 family)